ncbi:MAG: serine hydrolase domain-containing protein [Gemmataceae bacterium]
MSRQVRACAALLAILILTEQACGQPPAKAALPDWPISGKAIEGTEALDAGILTIMKRHGIPGGALAIARDGKLLFARGYGWANLQTNEQVQPDTRFGVASLSKTITALAVLKLVEQGKLKLDDKAFPLIGHIKPAPNVKVDPRLYQITVRQLLNHSGGWNHAQSGDPVDWTTQVHVQRGLRQPKVTAEELISFSMKARLDFDPGTDSKYSNFGYIVLGEIVEKAAGQPYEKYVKEQVLAPMGIKTASLHPPDGAYFSNEARRYLAGQREPLHSWTQQYSDAAGGWTFSVVDMTRLLTALDGSRGKPFLNEAVFKEMVALPPAPLKVRPNGTHVGLGWDSVILTDKGYGYFKEGSWFGMRAYMKRLPSGTNWVIMFNASLHFDPTDTRVAVDAVRDVREAMERLGKLPAVDLFNDFR